MIIKVLRRSVITARSTAKYQVRQIEAELADETSLRHAIYHELSRLIVIRRNNKAFHPDSDFQINSITPAVMQIKRTAETGEEITGLFNVSGHTQTICIDIENGVDLIGGKLFPVRN